MTREEAKRRLLNIERSIPNTFRTKEEVRNFEALEMAIKALEQNERAEEWYKVFVEKFESCEDAVSRQAVETLVDELARAISDERCCVSRGRSTATIMQDILDLPSVNPQEPKFIAKADGTIEQIKNCDDCLFKKKWGKIGKLISVILEKQTEQEPKTGHCKDCKYFEYDSVAKVDGIPLIVAHEICNKWGDGCKTKEDGYCFLFKPQER